MTGRRRVLGKDGRKMFLMKKIYVIFIDKRFKNCNLAIVCFSWVPPLAFRINFKELMAVKSAQ